ncbi:P-loop containing nucleoside triphosphate hydrolase protein [Limtongia smithiae]|uniref:P-loop containing nucleoside triphosphate hydrolase protein n=1 Tax=Limtongia smithiae TaxID=1125753 RepID=UPI0034CD6DA8
MESTFADLAAHCIALLSHIPAESRIIVAISGIPGSGKTTLGTAVVSKINELWMTACAADAEKATHKTQICAFVPMDGFHLTRAQLAAMPNAEEAIARRGAPFTFDPESLLSLVQKLRVPVSADAKSIYAPSFDHAVKDPIENDIKVLPTDRIIIIEGLYLMLEDSPWNQIADLMDELWFVNVERAVARDRIIRRHLEAGIARNEAEAIKRADESDLVNGDYIVSHSLTPDKMIISIQDDRIS